MRLRLSILALALVVTGTARADEGMWTYDNLPLKKMKEKYGFAPDQAWLDHLRLSVVRFPNGTGSFVSKDGLVLTNHHVGRGAINQVSGTGEKNYLEHGFVAKTRAEEIKVPGLALLTLESMENVTAQVNGAVQAGAAEKEALKQRNDALTALIEAENKKTGLQCEPVVLYQGGEYWIYRYKRHTDVRLVMAPEQQIAFFGGDPDNFTYPRHDLDFSLFRVYENDKPYTPPHNLQWTKGGLKDGDLTFVSGNPGSTFRLYTLAQMGLAKDAALPLRIESLKRQVEVLKAFSAKSEANALLVNTQIFGLENTIKALTGQLGGLRDAESMQAVIDREQALRAAVAKDPKLAASTGDSWAKVEAAMKVARDHAKEQVFLNTRNSQLLALALNLVRYADEMPKPSDQRLAEFVEGNRLKATQAALTRPMPTFNRELELALFTDGLTEAKIKLGEDHPFVKAVLGGKSPAEVAKLAVEGSKLEDPAVRKALMEGGAKAVSESTDTMIALAKKIDGMGRMLRKTMDEQVTAVVTEHQGRIARARFAVYGKDAYPDATFTLRLTYGPVSGYPANGTKIQPFTTLAGLYDRAWGWGPTAEHGAWALPKRWQEKQGAVNLSTPLAFSHAVDIVGGNSGSSVVDRKGELVGLIYDGNIESLPGSYFYDGRVNRGVSLDARAILEALDKVYDAKHLAAELKGN